MANQNNMTPGQYGQYETMMRGNNYSISNNMTVPDDKTGAASSEPVRFQIGLVGGGSIDITAESFDYDPEDNTYNFWLDADSDNPKITGMVKAKYLRWIKVIDNG